MTKHEEQLQRIARHEAAFDRLSAAVRRASEALDALDALRDDHDYLTAGGVFPEELIDLWIEKKKADYQKVHSIPHPAEFSLYYDL